MGSLLSTRLHRSHLLHAQLLHILECLEGLQQGSILWAGLLGLSLCLELVHAHDDLVEPFLCHSSKLLLSLRGHLAQQARSTSRTYRGSRAGILMRDARGGRSRAGVDHNRRSDALRLLYNIRCARAKA